MNMGIVIAVAICAVGFAIWLGKVCWGVVNALRIKRKMSLAYKAAKAADESDG